MAEDEIIIPSKEDEEDRIKELNSWFRTAKDAERAFLLQAEEDEQFYFGNQWDASVKKELEDAGKPALTYNYIFSLVNLINGYNRQNKMDIKVFNVRSGSQAVAQILNQLIKHTNQTKNGEWEISYAHLMGMICGKSYLGLNIDYDQDMMNGELYLEFAHCQDITVDPFGTRYDLEDRDYFFKSVWMPKSRIDRMYKGKMEGKEFSVLDEDKALVTGMETHNYADGAKQQIQEEKDIRLYRYRVKECWWKEYKEQKFLVNADTGKVFNVSTLKKDNIKKIAQANPQLRMIERVRPELHMSQYVGNCELYHTDQPLGGMTNFPLVGFFPYFLRNTSQGVITQLKDPQREHNKRMSQALHHLNSSANSGYTADADAVDDWDELKANISKAGYIKKIKAGKRFEKDHPTELSQGHIILAKEGAAAIKMISGVNSDLLGQDSTETISGVAIARRQAQGLMTTEIIHDNFKLTMKILGDRMVEAIQKSGAYSKQEILRLIIDGNETEIEINKKMEGVQKVMNDLTVGRYETTVNVAINTPTARMANFASLLEALKMGVPIPPDILVEASDWPEKEKIMERIQQQMQQQADAAKVALNEKSKDRSLELEKIKEKTQGDLLKKAQDTHLELLKDHAGMNGKREAGRTASSNKEA